MSERVTTLQILTLALEAIDDDRAAKPGWTLGVHVVAMRTREPQLARWIAELLSIPDAAVEETLARYRAENTDAAYAAHCRALAASLLRRADEAEGRR